jgi:hypothetical protein
MRKTVMAQILVLLLALAVAATLVAGCAAAPTTTTSAASKPKLRFFPWQPGTAMPGLAANEVLRAWPSSVVLRELKPGQSVRALTMGHTTASGRYVSAGAALGADTNASGFVNVEESPAGCGLPELQTYEGYKWTVVGASFAYKINVSQSFTYGVDQSSSLSVGLSSTGKTGSFSAAGTVSVDTSNTQTFPVRTGYLEYETEFGYAMYRTICFNAKGNGGVSVYTVSSYGWVGGDKVVYPKHAPHATHCVDESAGSVFSENKTAAVTFSGGFSVLGFSGSAQTGYSTTASINFTFHANGKLCGTNAAPGLTPKLLVAEG